MIVIAHRSITPEREQQPRFWIDPREEAALATHVYERFDSDHPANGNGRRPDAAPELTTCYDACHE
ncbi:MAG: hypothetical protein R2844_08945 [Caldilineales bacterium]